MLMRIDRLQTVFTLASAGVLFAAANSLPLLAGPALTVYNQNFGVVRDTVPLDLTAGINEASYSGVTAQLEPESVVLRDPSGELELRVIEQSYRGDPVDQARLLQMFEGETIGFAKTVGDREIIVEGRIVRAPKAVMARNHRGGNYQATLEPIIEVDGQVMTGFPASRFFPASATTPFSSRRSAGSSMPIKPPHLMRS